MLQFITPIKFDFSLVDEEDELKKSKECTMQMICSMFKGLIEIRCNYCKNGNRAYLPPKWQK